MPYVTPIVKRRLHELWQLPHNAGELNYLITKLLKDYWEAPHKEKNYQTINDIVGALEGAKQEFYRRVVVPYEDFKIKENGDVYD